MIASSSCCLNISHPPSSSSIPMKTSKPASNWQKKKDVSWGNQSVLSVACVIVVLQMDNINLGGIALADDLQTYVIESTNEKLEMKRWSNKTRCTPWRLNSLETIVPENLPRQAAHRKWENVGFTGETAPPVKGVAIRNSSKNSCFSM